MARKKVKLKKKNILKLLLFLLIIYFIVNTLFNNKDFKVEILNEPVVIDKEGNLELKFKATYKKEDVTEKVVFSANQNDLNVNKYKITFKYNLNEKDYELIISVKIKDEIDPVITLDGGNEIVLTIGDNYKEPGYKVLDNFDKDITSKVKVEGKVNASKKGAYIIKYSVSDSSNNKAEVIRTVNVTESRLDLNKKDFSLDGLYPNTLIVKSEYREGYADDFIIAGDSVALYYVMNQIIPGSRLWHKNGINPETALTNEIFVSHQETGKTFIEVFEEKKPKKVIFTLGTNSVSFMEVNFFISNYKKLLEGIKKASPDTLLVVQSIPPVAKISDDTGKITNDKINKFNYYLLKLCDELNIPFLNSAEVLKDSQGNLKDEYARLDEKETPGVHLSKEGNKVIYDYINSHVIK
ncbi:MAG: DUF5011 domain-containing protein [Bacilli bacterium]|nr:DUF5011 domain-containing protein [Bacilli bacterium]